MAITLKYVLVCDEVRQENNGKYIIIGLYAPDMAVPQIPFVLPSLTFAIGLESDRPGNLQVRMALQHLDSGQQIAQGMGIIGLQRAGLGVFPIRFGNLPIQNAGSYMFSLNIEGERDPITASFAVIIATPQQQQGMGIQPLGR